MVKVCEVKVFAAAALVALASTGCFRAERSCSTDDECLVGEECTVEQFCVRVRLTPDEDASSGGDDAGGGGPDTGAPDDVGGPGDGGEDAPQGCPPRSERCNGICCVSTIEGGALVCRDGAGGCGDYVCSEGFEACGDGNGCCPEATVGVPPDAVLATDAAGGFFGNDVELVVAPDGTTHAFFSYADPGNDSDLKGLRYRAYDGDGWSPAVFVDQTEGAGRGISAAVDPDGTVHVMWSRDFTGEDGIELGTFYSFKRAAGAQWSAPLSLSGDIESAGGQLAAGGDGVHAVFSVKTDAGGGIAEVESRYVHIVNGVVGREIPLGDRHDNSATRPGIALGAGGIPHVLFAQGEDLVLGAIEGGNYVRRRQFFAPGGVELGVDVELMFDSGSRFAVAFEGSRCVYGGEVTTTDISVEPYPSCADGVTVVSPSLARQDGRYVVSTYHDVTDEGLYLTDLPRGDDGWSNPAPQYAGVQVGTASAIAEAPGGALYVLYADANLSGRTIEFYTIVP